MLLRNTNELKDSEKICNNKSDKCCESNCEKCVKVYIDNLLDDKK